MIAITFMTILTGCEMTVNQDESALVMELDALDTAIVTLESKVDSNYDIFMVAYADFLVEIEDLEIADAEILTSLAELDAYVMELDPEIIVNVEVILSFVRNLHLHITI